MALPKPQVPPLTTLAFYTVIKHTWRCSGASRLFVQHACNSLACNVNPKSKTDSAKLTLYFKTTDRVIKDLLHLDCLPRSLIIKLANCYIDFDKNMREYIFSLFKALKQFKKNQLERCIENIVVTGDGRIDKRRSLTKIALSADIIFERNYTAYFCVGQNDILKALKEKYHGVEIMIGSCKELRFNSVLSFCNPDAYWSTRCDFAEMSYHFYQCVAVYGTKEAMEYFLHKIEPSQRQTELSKAAAYTVGLNSLDLEKMLFFYKNMEKSVWVEFLMRNFHRIFPEFLCNKRYRQMCMVFFRQVREFLDYKIHFWIVEYLVEQFTLQFRTPAHEELLMGDIEPMLISAWYLTPREYKEEFDNKIFMILNILMMYEKFNIIAIIIEDPAYNEQKRLEMIGCVVMNLIMNNKFVSIGQLIKKLKKTTLEDEKKITDLVTCKNLKTYIMLCDKCQNVDQYNTILEFKYTSLCELKLLKRKLLMDTDFISGIVDSIREPNGVTVYNFQKLMAWCFCNSQADVYRYMLHYLLPFDYMTSIFRNYLISTRKTFYSITGFCLTESQVQAIRMKICKPEDQLYNHWANLIAEQDYEAVHIFLNTVFRHQVERENFLVNFFNSQIGVHALYNMIVEETYDEEFYCNFEFRKKLRSYLKFRHHVVITRQVAMSLDGILQHYGHPNASNFQLQISFNRSLFPYENLEDMRVVNDANYRIFRCLMSSELMVDFITDMLMMINMPLSHITELSVMYELHAGISVPVIL